MVVDCNYFELMEICVMKKSIFAFLILCAASGVVWGLSAEQKVVFEADFDDAAGITSGRLVKGYEGTRSLLIELSAAGILSQGYSIDAAAIAGKLVTISAVVKADGVSEGPESWNGIKVMLVLEAGKGRDYPQVSIPAGTFDWKRFSHTLRIPAGVEKASLVLGLEKVKGRVWFDEVEIRTGRIREGCKRSEVMFRGHDLDRLRGVMLGPVFREQDIRDLALEWKANQIRWQLNWVPMKEAEDWAADSEAFDKWLDGALGECDKALDACEKYGLKVLVDLHTPPGGRTNGGVCRMFSEKRYQDKLIEVWGKIARRYKGRDVVYAYDLLNEAVEGSVSAGLMNWRELATAAAKTIRQVDPGKPVVFEPSPWGGPDGFDALVPLDIDRVIYSFHMYKPHQFTHQGVYDSKADLVYPGLINGIRWDKESLRAAMAAAIDFQEEFNVHIYVGEFSAIRWAPDNSAYRYLRDAIELFEEYGWDWSYHAFREWDGWSLEHGAVKEDRKPTAEPTDRKKLFLKWFAENEKALSVKPLKRAHAHNDYEHDRPLFDAMGYGFCSVEADIHLVDGKLLVAHDLKDVRAERTLESLYLDPLLLRVRRNGGSVHPGGGEFTLLVDVKTDGELTYAALDRVLSRYAKMLVVVRDGTEAGGAVRVIVSGNRVPDTMARQRVRFAGMDGRVGDLDSEMPGHFMPWISDNASKVINWRGNGPFPDEDRGKLEGIVRLAHEKGRKVRLWGVPDRAVIWDILRQCDVDVIGADNLRALAGYLRSLPEK